MHVRKKGNPPSSARATAPSGTEPAPAGANPPLSATTSSKPKSSKPPSHANGHKARSPSPSPPPPPARPALQTIRLEITLGGPEAYEVDIAKLSKETGQRPPTPPRAISPHRDESEDSEPEPEVLKDGKIKKRRKRVSVRTLRSCYSWSSERPTLSSPPLYASMVVEGACTSSTKDRRYTQLLRGQSFALRTVALHTGCTTRRATMTLFVKPSIRLTC